MFSQINILFLSISCNGHKYHPYFTYQDYSLWTQFKIPIFGEIKFNPIVSLLSILLIFLLVAWCIVEKENVPFLFWRSTLTDSFTWLYIGVFNLCVIFVVVVYFR